MANNSNNQKKYASLATLQNFLNNLKNLFATKTDVNTELAKKADSAHTHTIANVTNLQSSLDAKVPTSRTVNGKALTANISLSASDVGAATSSHSHDDRYYTESEVDTKLSGKANAVHTHTVSNITDLTATATELNHLDGVTSNVQAQIDSKLSTSGGTISGVITTTDGDAINRDVNTSGTHIYGGVDYDNGATLSAYGKDHASYAGYFRLRAENGEEFTALEGRPDGTLKWDEKNVLTVDRTGAVPITSGGTGATTASGALQNLGITASATELNYMDGATSNVQAQLDALSSDLESHAHSASDIISGTMDAARLPKASGTAAGIMSTGTQTIAGTKTFTSQIKPAGIQTSGSILADTNSTHDIGSVTSAFKNVYIDKLCINPERVNGSAIFGGSFEVEKVGTDTQIGIAKLKVGNPTQEGTAGNAQGYIQIYNENNGSVTLETDHSDDYAFRVSLPRTTGRLVTNNEVYTIEDQRWNLLYDSGEISAIANSISNIDVSGYTNIQVLVRCYNDGDSINSRAGSAIFTCKNGKTYQFPVWSNMFSKSINTVYTMATFNLVDGWLVCPYASRLIGDASTFDDEGGTAGNLSLTGSGMMKCTSQLSTLTISNLDQNSNYYFGMGSRVMVWGWNA